jgi:SAM-dependent methyltransferase
VLSQELRVAAKYAYPYESTTFDHEDFASTDSFRTIRVISENKFLLTFYENLSKNPRREGLRRLRRSLEMQLMKGKSLSSILIRKQRGWTLFSDQMASDIDRDATRENKSSTRRLVKLHLGCGSQVLDGWINVDYALGARFAKIPFFRALNRKLKLFDTDWNEKIYLHNLTKRFPWTDSSVDIVYTSHTLEHLTKEDGQRFLNECLRVLRHDGIIRIVVPDLSKLVLRYTDGEILADDFVEELGVLYGRYGNKLKNRVASFIEFPHKCMYDSPRLIAILREIGFDATNRSPFDSAIDDIRLIESMERTEDAVIVEGEKAKIQGEEFTQKSTMPMQLKRRQDKAQSESCYCF